MNLLLINLPYNTKLSETQHLPPFINLNHVTTPNIKVLAPLGETKGEGEEKTARVGNQCSRKENRKKIK